MVVPSIRLRAAAASILIVLPVVAIAGVRVARDPIVVLRVAQTALLKADGVGRIDADGVFLQRTLYDCGPAALANLLLLVQGRSPAMDTLAVLAGTTMRGTTLSGLQKAATAFDLDVVSVGARSGERDWPSVPFIAWIDRNHFVVVAARTDRGDVLIIDPRVGRYVMDERSFQRRWSGEALLVAPSPPQRMVRQ
jgi:ABC-type bacteriocin/lantibiotic exporter with double-glycine peptidase domain